MTTIAYRDGIFAADSLITAGNMIVGYVDKIFRSPSGDVGAVAGSLEDMTIFEEWMRGGANGRPVFSGEVDGIFVSKVMGLYYIGSKGIITPVTVDFTAVGSGEKFAMGAMASGKTAKEAVEIAITLDTTSGGHVQTMSVDHGL